MPQTRIRSPHASRQRQAFPAFVWFTMSDVKLRVIDSHGKRVVPLDKPLFTIGRRTAADLKLGGVDVSRDHAEIAWDGDQYVLRDVGSSHGTFVNGQRIAKHTLAHGDRIR